MNYFGVFFSLVENILLIVLLVVGIAGLTLGSKGTRSRCPPDQLLSPCFCNSIPKFDERLNCNGTDIVSYQCQIPVITCIGSGLNQIGQIFANVSYNTQNVKFQKFEWFYLVDYQLRSLENEVFGHLFFRNIYIQNCPNLLVIKPNAFGKSGSFVKNIFINATKLSNNAKLRRSTFVALSSLTNLEVLEIQTSSFTAIPYKAFNRHNNIQIIRFYNPDARQKLRKISSKAFYKANKLEEIDLKNNEISKISSFAFEFFQEAKGQELRIFLSGNYLHSESFDKNALSGGNGRKVILYLGDYDNCNTALTTLRQDVFELFLLENQGNVIDMYGCPLVCDKQLEWLTLRMERFRYQVRNLICYNQTSLLNSDSYAIYNVAHK